MKKFTLTSDEVSNLKGKLSNPKVELHKPVDYVNSMLNRKKEAFEVIRTGIAPLDDILDGGFYRKSTYYIASRPSIGKTTLMLQLAKKIATNGKRVLIVSLENAPDQNLTKILSSITNELSDIWSMKGAGLSYNEITNIEKFDAVSEPRKNLFYDALDELEIINIGQIYKPGSMTVDEVIDAILDDVQTTGEVSVIMIDYLQCFKGIKPGDTEKSIADDAAEKLKSLAIELNTVVICLSSIPRSYYKKDLELFCFKESGGIEYGAEVALALQFPPIKGEITDDMYNFYTDQTLRNLELKLLKNRNGKMSKERVKLTLDGNFSDIIEGHIGPVYQQAVPIYNYCNPISQKPTAKNSYR